MVVGSSIEMGLVADGSLKRQLSSGGFGSFLQTTGLHWFRIQEHGKDSMTEVMFKQQTKQTRNIIVYTYTTTVI